MLDQSGVLGKMKVRFQMQVKVFYGECEVCKMHFEICSIKPNYCPNCGYLFTLEQKFKIMLPVDPRRSENHEIPNSGEMGR